MAACGSATTDPREIRAADHGASGRSRRARSSRCPSELHDLRLDSTHLAAGYDSTAGATVAAAERRGLPPGLSPLAKLAPTKPVVLCWYTDAAFTPPAGRGTPSASGGAVVVYVDEQALVVQSINGEPERPR